MIRGDQKVALQATGAADLSLGNGFASASATGVGVAFNNTGADIVNRTVTVAVGGVSVSAPLNVKNGQVALVVTGLQAQVADFVSLSGDFGIQKTPGATADQDELLIVSNQAAASLTAGTLVRAGVSKATVALMIRGDQKLALQATGAVDLSLGDGFASASATGVGVVFNNTGSDIVNRTVTVAVGEVSVSAPLNVKNGQAALVVTGLQAQIAGFVSLSGDFGIQRTPGATPAQDELLIVSNQAAASLTAGTLVRAGVSKATVALMIRGDQKLALQATGAVDLSLGNGFAGASATGVGVTFNNTGADIVNRTVTVAVGGVSVSAPLNVKNGQAALVVTGLQAQVAGFVSLSGDFGIQRTPGATPAQDELLIVSNQAAASLTAGTLVRAGVSKATVALMIRGDQKLALQATGAVDLSLGNGFASASATAVGVAFNNTEADIENRTVTVSIGAVSVSAPLNVKKGEAALVVSGLQAQVAGFVTVSGNFGVQRTPGATAAQDELVFVSNQAAASLTAGTLVRAGVSNATLAVMIRGDQKLALQATGAVDLSLGNGFASARASEIGIAFNNTGADVDRTVSVSVGDTTIAAPLQVADKTGSLTVTGLTATVGGFVTLSGDFGVKKTFGATAADDELWVVSTGAAASLTTGSAIRVGVKDASLALLIRGDQKLALQASGAVDLSLGAGFASATATSVSVVFNNTGVDQDRVLAVALGTRTISAALKAVDNTTVVSMEGLSAQVGGFVRLGGNFGFRKQGDDIQVVAQGASALLTAGGVEVGVTGAELALMLPAQGGVQLQASGTPVLTLPTAFASVSVAKVTVSYNNTANAVDTRVTVGSVSAPLTVGANTAAVVATGFEASLGGFVTLKGDFGFSKTGNDIQVVAQGASALMTAGGVEVGGTGAE
jgi:hypothetical protein